MGEMVNYIFKSMGRTETAIHKINKNLKLQSKFNNRAALFCCLTAAYIFVSGRMITAQGEQIKKLNDEIEKMKERTESCEGSTESES